MVRQSGALALSSLHNVFLSLPDKSRSVYTILVKYQIENSGANYQGRFSISINTLLKVNFS